MAAVQVDVYGHREGTPIHRITVEEGGLRAVFLDDGARLLELHVPGRSGEPADVVLGYPDVAAHTAGAAYFGATCGRYANRIRRGSFELDGAPFAVSINEGENHLHGGQVGFDRYIWGFDVDEASGSVTFDMTSPAGDQGYPGELAVRARYTLGEGRLDITMTAETTEPTVVNLVHHSYWNLAGHASGDVLGHELTIASDFYTPVDDELIPTGEILSVADTPFDFRTPTPIGANIRAVDHGGAGRESPAGFAGYDHNWAIRGQLGTMRPCVTAVDPVSGRRLDLETNEAAVQFYPGGYLADVAGKDGATYRPFQGFTLETQRFPDSPNWGHFPSTVLRPGERYDHRMAFRFSIEG